MKNIFLKLGISVGVLAILTFAFIAFAKDNEKVTICHMTGSENNPYVRIKISVNALDEHMINHGDSGVDADGNCPGSGPDPD